MIEVKNMTIKYGDKIILDNVNLKIFNNCVTYILGESGSGKTSLLHAIANLDDKNAEYFAVDGINVKEMTLEQKNAIKKYSIMRIDQDESLIKNYTVMENLELILQSKGQSLDESKLFNLLEKFDLAKNKLSKKMNTLSNGERQRIGIIASLLGDYEIYIFDEPTSALDSKNKKIVNILLDGLAKSGKIVIISQHDRIESNNCILYNINDSSLSLDKAIDTGSYRAVEVKPYHDNNSKKIIFREAVNNIIHFPIFNIICLIALGICIALSSLFATYSVSMFNTQVDNLNAVYDKELFIIKDSSEASKFSIPYDTSSITPINQSVLNEISSLENIKSIEPNFYFTLEQIQYNESGKIEILDLDQLGNISYINNNEVKKVINYKELGIQKLLIGPTYTHQKFDERCQTIDLSKEGIYISDELAKSLQIHDIQNSLLTFNISVPIASEAGVKEIDKEKEVFELIRAPITVTKEITLPIRGILKSITTNSYLSGDMPMIYLPIDKIKEIMLETRGENTNLIEKLSTITVTDQLINKYSDKLLLSDKWEASAYVLEVDNFQNIDKVKSQIININNDLLIRDSYFNGSVTSALVNQQKILSLGITGVLIILIIILTSFIKHFRLKKKKNYYNFLTKLGWTNNEISSLKKKEIWIFMGLLLFIVYLFLYTINMYFFFELKSSFTSHLVILVTFIIIVAIHRIKNKKEKEN